MNIVGIDIGYGDVKIVSDSIEGCLAGFPTLITPAKEGSFEVSEQESKPITVGGKKYHVGEDAKKATHLLDLKFETWLEEDEYMALYLKALSFVEPGVLSVVTGLPVSEYSRWKEFLSKKLVGSHEVDGKHYNVQTVKVMPQPFGAFFNAALGSDGKVSNVAIMDEVVGIIDIGTRTTDFIQVDGGMWKEDGASGSIDRGVSNLIDAVTKRVAEKHKSELSVLKAREAISNKEIKVFGVRTDITHIVDEEATQLATFIVHKAKAYWKNGANIETLLLTGGGSYVFRKYLEKAYPHVILTKNPAYSNAMGYWKWGVAKLGIK